jgi:hypothetical protein
MPASSKSIYVFVALARLAAFKIWVSQLIYQDPLGAWVPGLRRRPSFECGTFVFPVASGGEEGRAAGSLAHEEFENALFLLTGGFF